jgi:hypothetical protein
MDSNIHGWPCLQLTGESDCSMEVVEKEATMNDRLKKLIDASRGKVMTDAEKEAQRRSFAYGNAHIENDLVTRQMVDEAAEKISRTR